MVARWKPNIENWLFFYYFFFSFLAIETLRNQFIFEIWILPGEKKKVVAVLINNTQFIQITVCRPIVVFVV